MTFPYKGFGASYKGSSFLGGLPTVAYSPDDIRAGLDGNGLPCILARSHCSYLHL